MAEAKKTPSANDGDHQPGQLEDTRGGEIFILDDLPTERDGLDFMPYVQALVDVCTTASTPLTIGVFGTWGSGKTSLLKMVQKNLPPEYTLAWFDAWKYDKEETLWRAFLLTVLLAVEDRIGETEEIKALKTMLYRGLDLEKVGGVTIDLARLGAVAAQGAVQIGLSFIPPLAQLAKFVEELQKSAAQTLTGDSVDAIRRERTRIHIEQIRSLEQFQGKFRDLIESCVAPRRLVVFIDDLDRCLPEKAIEVLEAIKLFVDVPHCVFLLGLDHEVIARGVEMRYKDFQAAENGSKAQIIDGGRYLEKIIQLPFTIPPVERGDMEEFIQGLTTAWPHPACPLVFARGLGNNPRQIKRTVNVFLMLWRLAYLRENKLQGQVKPVRLAKVVTIQAIAPELYRLLTDQPGLLRDIELYYRQEAASRAAGIGEGRGAADAGKAQEAVRQQLPEALLRLVAETPAVGEMLTMHPQDDGQGELGFSGLKPDELRLYFTLTRRAEAPQSAPQAASRQVFEPALVRIPSGEFWMGSTPEQLRQAGVEPDHAKAEQPQHRVMLGEYFIGKYPVTCREYQVFVQDSGRSAPQGWSGDQFPPERGDHPVTNVSWEDAQAYCAWLKAKTGREYRLPTEAEWEKAARGSDGRMFPWGDSFDKEKANVGGFVGGTTPVGQYSPQGDSPYGCADMAGNVWEWCLDWYGEDEYARRFKAGKSVEAPHGPESGDPRVLRGGSFLTSPGLARCAYRLRDSPRSWLVNLGFRAVVVSPVFVSER